MCELFSLASRLPTVATFSLQTFAQHGGGKGSSVDGWGLAADAERNVRLYKEPEPMADTDWLHPALCPRAGWAGRAAVRFDRLAYRCGIGVVPSITTRCTSQARPAQPGRRKVAAANAAS